MEEEQAAALKPRPVPEGELPHSQQQQQVH